MFLVFPHGLFDPERHLAPALRERPWVRRVAVVRAQHEEARQTQRQHQHGQRREAAGERQGAAGRKHAAMVGGVGR